MRGQKIPYEENHKLIGEIENKKCSDCLKWMPLNDEYFYKNKSSPDGFNPYCKECAKVRSMKFKKNNPEKVLIYAKTDNAKVHRKIQTRETNRQRRENGKYKEWQLNNKEKLTEYQQKRLMNKRHEVTNEEWENCKNYFNYRCAYCNLPIEEHYIFYRGKETWSDFHREHVDHEGTNDLSNCVPSCRSCNSSKINKRLEDWYSPDNEFYCKVYSYERLQKIHKWLNEDFKKYIILNN